MTQIVLAKDLYAEIKEAERVNGERPKYLTGFSQFDDGKRFGRPGQLHIIAGASGGGKSTLARTLLYRFEQNGTKCVFFSLEETYDEFLEECQSLNFYMPKEIESDRVAWVLEHALQAKKEHNATVAFIDNFTHLGEPTEMKKLDKSNSAQRYGMMVQEIHDFAIKHDLCIFLLHHVNQDAGAGAWKGDTSKPLFGQYHLRETSQLANLANSVIFIHRITDKMTKEDTRYSLVYTGKWRSGGKTPRFTVALDGKLFEEETVDHWIEDNKEAQRKLSFKN